MGAPLLSDGGGLLGVALEERLDLGGILERGREEHEPIDTHLRIAKGPCLVHAAERQEATYFAHPRLAWRPVVDIQPLTLALVWLRHRQDPLLSLLLRESRRAVAAGQVRLGA